MSHLPKLQLVLLQLFQQLRPRAGGRADLAQHTVMLYGHNPSESHLGSDFVHCQLLLTRCVQLLVGCLGLLFEQELAGPDDLVPCLRPAWCTAVSACDALLGSSWLHAARPWRTFATRVGHAARRAWRIPVHHRGTAVISALSAEPGRTSSHRMPVCSASRSKKRRSRPTPARAAFGGETPGPVDCEVAGPFHCMVRPVQRTCSSLSARLALCSCRAACARMAN